MRAQAKTEAELGNLEQALGRAQLIIEAARKLPPATEKEQKEKGKGGKPKEQQ
jgi:sulfur transfer protein SufE